MATQNTATAVAFLEELAKIVEKSPATYSTDAAQELADSIRSMAEEVTKDARVDTALLDVTRQYASLEWHAEIAAVLIPSDHRNTVH